MDGPHPLLTFLRCWLARHFSFQFAVVASVTVEVVCCGLEAYVCFPLEWRVMSFMLGRLPSAQSEFLVSDESAEQAASMRPT